MWNCGTLIIFLRCNGSVCLCRVNTYTLRASVLLTIPSVLLRFLNGRLLSCTSDMFIALISKINVLLASKTLLFLIKFLTVFCQGHFFVRKRVSFECEEREFTGNS